MGKLLNVLIIEDSEKDAELVVRELVRSGYEPSHKRVNTADGILTLLQNESWDVIISALVMSRLNGLDALKIVREKGIDSPFIITSEKIDDDKMVQAVKAGATDYIIKNNLKRLGPAIERELKEASTYKVSKALEDREEELRVLKKLDQLKDEFVGLVSHELRTPITIILGALSTVITEGERLSRQQVRGLISDAYYEAETLSDILANLLELARAQANRLQITEERVNVGEAIDVVVNRLMQQPDSHKIVIYCDKSLTVVADRVKLQLILHNLLDNAIKYSPSGTEIEVFAQQNVDEVLIGVKDQGKGISLEEQGKLFEAFQRLEHDNKAPGTGLGLVVCHRLVEAHGGSMWVESKPGKGSTFYFTIPTSKEGLRKT